MSALDVHVGTQLFEDGILDILLDNNRTVVLVTHQVQYIKYAHKVSSITSNEKLVMV